MSWLVFSKRKKILKEFARLNEIIEKRKTLEDVLQEISEKNEDLNNFKNSFSEEKTDIIEKQKQIEELRFNYEEMSHKISKKKLRDYGFLFESESLNNIVASLITKI